MSETEQETKENASQPEIVNVPLNKYRYKPDNMGLMDAVWDFLLEHCDVTDEGSFFVKFHVDSKRNFLNRVLSRWKYNYHRDDPRETNEKGIKLKEEAQDRKDKKKQERLDMRKSQPIKRRIARWAIRQLNKV